MEEFTDLRNYIALLLHRWQLILGGALLAAVVAFTVSSLMKPTYEATAVIVGTIPRDLVQFDARFETIAPDVNNQPLEAFSEIAKSDELLQNLLSSLTFSMPDIESLEDFRELLTVETGKDASLIRLKVQYQNPEQTAAIVNQWASLLIVRLNEIYFDLGGGQVEFYQSQMAAAESELTAADQALIEFEANNNSKTLQNQLNSLNQLQNRYLKEQRDATFLIQDIQALRGQLLTQPDDQISFADQLTAMSLQVQAFDAQQSLPVQIQLTNADILTNQNREDQIAYLDEMVKSLETLVTANDSKLIDLEPRILQLQQEIEQVDVVQSQLDRDQRIAEETYLSLARKVEEERITAQDDSKGVILASEAAVPQKPVAPRKMANTILAGLVAAMLAIGLIFALEWWYAGVEIEAQSPLSPDLAGNGYRRKRQGQVLETESGD